MSTGRHWANLWKKIIHLELLNKKTWLVAQVVPVLEAEKRCWEKLDYVFALFLCYFSVTPGLVLAGIGGRALRPGSATM